MLKFKFIYPRTWNISIPSSWIYDPPTNHWYNCITFIYGDLPMRSLRISPLLAAPSASLRRKGWRLCCRHPEIDRMETTTYVIICDTKKHVRM